MVVTSIVPGRKGLSRVLFDGEQVLRLDTELLIQQRIQVGSRLSQEDLEELVRLSNARRASEKAMYLLEYRSHSRKELEEKVARVAGKEAAQKAVDRMEDLGFIDDLAYARAYGRELLERKKYGVQRVRQEFYRKGIDREIIDQVLEEYEGDSPEEKIRQILERKYSGFREDEKLRRRAFAALRRMGYRYEEIRAAMEIEDQGDF